MTFLRISIMLRPFRSEFDSSSRLKSYTVSFAFSLSSRRDISPKALRDSSNLDLSVFKTYIRLTFGLMMFVSSEF